MSGKMKKLICALLTSTMLVSSIGLVGFAADEEATTDATTTVEATEAPATEETTEATEAPAEATEAPAEATEAPVQATTSESTKYDDDNYYQRAVSLCKALGIITGYEDGSVKPESTVTRAEMAAIILRMLNNTTSSTYQNIFTDVTSSHWAANTIQTASSLNIINGMGDGTFVPDGNVTYEQVAKMIICAMNFQDTAEYYGGYPNGYLKAASDMDITKNASGTTGVASDRGTVIKMVYNALLADYNEPNGTEYGNQVFKAEKSLAEYAFDVKEDKGILLGTSTTSLTSKNLQSGQVLIDTDDDEGIVYTTDLTGLESLIASNVHFYYQEQENGDTRKLLAIVENTAKTETVTLSNDDINDIESFSGFNGEKGEIKLYGTKKYKLASNITVVYNGTVITEDDFDKAVAAKDSRCFDANGTAYTYAEFLQPAVGTIKLVENDSDSDGYDIAFIDSYETMVVSSATTKKVIGKINGTSVTIDVDEDANDLTISTTINGMEAAPRNLKKNNVASIKRSLDNETLEFVVTGESFTGSIKSITTDDGKTYITVNGTKYEVDANAVDDCKMGNQAIFYTDQFNRVGYIESATADGMLQSGESYGWIMNIYDSEDGEGTIVKLYTQDGKSVDATIGSSVDYWAPGATTNVTGTKAETIKADLLKDGSINNNKFLKLSSSSTTPIRIVKYKMNSSNELTRLYCAVDATTVSDTSALRINTKNLNGTAAVSGAVSGYTISDGILEFTAPLETSDMKLASNYSVGEVTSSNYVVRENGSSRDYVIGEFDGVSANIIIRFTASAETAAPYTEMGTADSGPSIMVIDTIAEGYDEDSDKSIYSITGYSGGSKVSVTTNKNTNLGDAKLNSGTPAYGVLERTNNQTYFGFTQLWTAVSSSTSLTDYLKKGDILFYTSDGRVLLRYASVSSDKSSITTLDSSSFYGTARVAYYFQKVVESGLDDTAWVKLEKYGTLMFDSSMAIDVVTINNNGKIEIEKETISVSEIEDGDYLFVGLADKQTTVKSMIIYRFED